MSEPENLDEYNPFTTQLTNDTSQPALLQLSDSTAPPPYNSPITHGLISSEKKPTMTVADLERRQQELDNRAAQLDLREREQQQQEMWRAEHGYGKVEIPNWPAFPKWCCCKPFTRLDIEGDIPESGRKIAYHTHWFWCSYNLILFFNMLVALFYFIASDRMDTGAFFGVSIIMALVIPPASFFCWNRPLYKALKNNSSLNFLFFFPCFGLQLVIIFIQVLGIDYLGACGWINSSKMLQKDKVIAICMLCVATLFSVCAICSVFIIIRVHRYYRSTGANSKKAKLEIRRDVITQGIVSSSSLT